MHTLQFTDLEEKVSFPVFNPHEKHPALDPALQEAGYSLMDVEVHHVRDRYEERRPLVSLLIAPHRFPLPETKDRNGHSGDRHLEYWRSGLEVLSCYSHDDLEG
jgi:hypothetical protein